MACLIPHLGPGTKVQVTPVRAPELMDLMDAAFRPPPPQLPAREEAAQLTNRNKTCSNTYTNEYKF